MCNCKFLFILFIYTKGPLPALKYSAAPHPNPNVRRKLFFQLKAYIPPKSFKASFIPENKPCLLKKVQAQSLLLECYGIAQRIVSTARLTFSSPLCKFALEIWNNVVCSPDGHHMFYSIPCDGIKVV